MSDDQGKRFADRAARTVSNAVEKSNAAATESARGAEQSYFAAAEGIRDFHVKLIEMAHANTLAALQLVGGISAANGPSESAALWLSYVRQQFETLTDQSKELTALAQRIATSSAETLSRSFSSAFKGTT
jgi:hypothetical protein